MFLQNSRRVIDTSALLPDLGGTYYCPDDARLRAAAAEIGVERAANLAFVGSRIPIEQCFCSEQHAVAAVAALQCLLVQECPLNRMRCIDGANSFERRHVPACYRHGIDEAGACRGTIYQHGAGTTLAETATKLRAIQIEVVAQHVEEFYVVINRDAYLLAVQAEIDRQFAPLIFALKRVTFAFGERLDYKVDKYAVQTIA